ncbi:MAG TPA: hypothetical protein VGP28_10360 [Methylocella sp.]|jgi:hypothetical protein|nr:hypothetical protein [Methylocella sp.]
MVSFKHLFRVVPMILASRCFAESLYLTTPAPLPPDDDRFVFITPYFAEVKTNITVSISQGAYNKDIGKNGPPVLTISVIPVPVSRGFLYLTKNPFFSDAANVSVSSDGLLSSSDSSSAQQITAILTELAQTAAGIFEVELELKKKETQAPKPSQDQKDRQRCMQMRNDLVTDMPYYKSFNIMGNNRTFYGVYYNSGDPGSENPKREKKDYASISLRLDIPPVFSDERVTLKDGAHYGLVAFYPVPSVATLNCRVGRRKFFELTPPQVINIYTESHLVDPQRDFFLTHRIHSHLALDLLLDTNTQHRAPQRRSSILSRRRSDL